MKFCALLRLKQVSDGGWAGVWTPQTGFLWPTAFFFFFFWLRWVLVAAHGIFIVACGLVALWPVLPGKSHGQRSLVGYSPWGCKRAGHDLVTKQQHTYIRFKTETHFHIELPWHLFQTQ